MARQSMLSIHLKLIYKFNAITNNIPTRFSTELERMVLNFIWKKNAKREPKAFFQKKVQKYIIKLQSSKQSGNS